MAQHAALFNVGWRASDTFENIILNSQACSRFSTGFVLSSLEAVDVWSYGRIRSKFEASQLDTNTCSNPTRLLHDAFIHR